MNNCLPLNELKELLNTNTAVVIDVRSAEEYEAMHIPNAMHIPLDQLEQAAVNFDKAKLYVTACGKGGGRSERSSIILKELGFNAAFLCGGTFGWFDN